jgi:hypothetical protein
MATFWGVTAWLGAPGNGNAPAIAIIVRNQAMGSHEHEQEDLGTPPELRDASVSAPLFLSSEDRPASPERKLGHPSGRLRRKGRKRKEQDMGRELSSQTATTMVAERFEALALELRFMALGLPIPGRFGADKQAA